MSTPLLTLVEDYAKIIDRLREDNERLRGLLKAREFGGLFCPSCLGGKVSEARHYEDCPAFTPDGEVK